MPDPRMLVIGGGSLSRSICYALSTSAETPARVWLLSRSQRNATDVCYMATVRAAVSGRPVRFEPMAVPEYTMDLLRPVLDELRPTVVLNCASHQSPWEGANSPSAWSDLMRLAGFGFVLPLQAAIAIDVARCVSTLGGDCLLVNACFPDAVNPVLTALGLPIFCGIGNVALLAAALHTATGATDSGELRVLGHHCHLHAPPNPADEARAWQHDSPIATVTELLTPMRHTTRSELNSVNGYVSARILDGLLGGRTTRASVPGPAGLPGGYPVHLRGREITLDLPDTVTRQEAIELNQRWAILDGVRVSDSGEVIFPARETILTTWPELAALPGMSTPLDVDGLQNASARLRQLRARLRLDPPAGDDQGTSPAS